ncbi:MAG: UbiA family prenyltransferase [Gemmatimonadota bacterium]
MAAHTALGYLLAVGVSDAARGQSIGPALAGIALWVVCLNGGTLALNSAFDRDEGDIGYLKSPPPVPAHLAAFAFVLLAAGLALATRLPRGFLAAYAICLVLSLLYSVPPLRLKAVAGADWLINMWGFGTLTPYAGFAVTGVTPEPFQRMVLFAFCPLFAALYPLTQIYQFEEDRQRGDRTLALILGIRRSLLIAVAAASFAYGVFFAAGLRAGWRMHGTDLVRWAGLVFSLLVWARVLVPWLLSCETMTDAEHQRGMYRGLAAWAVTDIVVILAWAT